MEIVRSYFEQFNTLRFEGMAEKFWHPEIEYREDPIWPEASTFRGADEVLAAFKRYEEVMGAYQIMIERIFDGGEQLGVVVRAAGRGATSGVSHEHRWGYLVRLEGQRVIYLQAFYDADKALEAAGFSE